MRDVLQKQWLMPHCDMVEEDQVLMNLPHISHVWHHRKTKDAVLAHG
jgi:hypothetical protein